MKNLVLFASNSEERQEEVVQVLQANDFIVHVAYDEESCTGSLEEDRPNLILLDDDFGSKNVLEYLAKIKRNHRYFSVPVVMMLSASNKGEVKKAAGLGVKGFLIKPVDREDLGTRVKRYIERGLDFEDLRDLFKKLQVTHSSLLKENGLRELDAHGWVPFPAKLHKTKLCILIRKGQNPQDLVSLHETQVAQNVCVYKQGDVRWEILWPTRDLLRKKKEDDKAA